MTIKFFILIIIPWHIYLLIAMAKCEGKWNYGK